MGELAEMCIVQFHTLYATQIKTNAKFGPIPLIRWSNGSQERDYEANISTSCFYFTLLELTGLRFTI